MEQLTTAKSVNMLGLSLIVVRNKENKFLAVREKRNRGWWLPGGKVDPPEDFLTAAIRESKEEASIDIELKGILRIEQNITSVARLKVVFYAEPIDQNQTPKQIPDSESEEARWVTLDELQQLGEQPPYLRGDELVEFGRYLENGGIIYPLEVLSILTASPSIPNI